MNEIMCQECPALWTDSSRWRAFLGDDEPVFYCPECAHREFGSETCDATFADLESDDLVPLAVLEVIVDAAVARVLAGSDGAPTVGRRSALHRSTMQFASNLRGSRDGWTSRLANRAVTLPPKRTRPNEVEEPTLVTPPDQGQTYQLENVTRCIECHATWTEADGSRWRAYMSDDEPAVVAIYCATCAGREFGG